MYRCILATTCLLLPSITFAQWPTTEWRVLCTEETLNSIIAEMIEYGIPPDEAAEIANMNCRDTGITGAASITRGQLEDAGPWLRDLGFPAPAVWIREDGKYAAIISDELTGHHKAWGVYYPSRERLYVSSSYWIHQDHSGDLGIFLNRPSNRTMVHELFHAIQKPYRTSTTRTSAHKWIWEGTAEAVEYSWFLFSEPDSPILHASTYRGIDESLHAPDPCGESCPGSYRRFHFWSKLGELLGSPGRIAYLDHIFQQDLVPDNGLTGLHHGLTRWNDGGLYHYYVEYVAQHTPDRFQFRDEGYIEETISPPPTGGFVEVPLDQSILPIAAQAFEIHIETNDDETVGVEISIDGNTENHHLIVDGVRFDQNPGSPENNTYSTYLIGTGEPVDFHIRVANIAPDPRDTQEEDYTLLVKIDGAINRCSEDALAAALNPTHPEARAMVAQAQTMRDQLVATDTRNVVFVLGRAEYSVAGDGGAACVSPFAVSDLEWQSDREEDYDYEGNMDAVIARYMPRAVEETGFTEAEIMDIIENGTMPPGATPDKVMRLMEIVQEAAALPLDGNEELSGVYFHIFEPNLIPALVGGISPERMRSENSILTRHSGLGGWKDNSASNLIVYMPGVQASEIEGGGVYPAVAYSLSDEDTAAPPEGPETSTALYTAWNGRFQTLRCNGEREDVFVGRQETVWGRLQGTVRIDEVTSTSIQGSFNLSGNGDTEVNEYRLVRRSNPDCPREQEEERNLHSTAVSVEGTFTAPNMRAPGTFIVAGVGRAAPMGR